MSRLARRSRATRWKSVWLSRRRIAQIYNFNDVYGSSWRSATRGFRILMLDRTVSSGPLAALLREPGARLLYSGHGVAVVERERPNRL